MIRFIGRCGLDGVLFSLSVFRIMGKRWRLGFIVTIGGGFAGFVVIVFVFVVSRVAIFVIE